MVNIHYLHRFSFAKHFSFTVLLCGVSISLTNDVTEDQVTFFLYNRESYRNGVQLTDDNLNLVNKTKPLHFLIHGWIASRNTSWFIEATDAYLNKGDYNVIQVDWSEPASQPVEDSRNATKPVGEDTRS